jgi:uncharacterized membrane protein YbhN (UPF0104 family)
MNKSVLRRTIKVLNFLSFIEIFLGSFKILQDLLSDLSSWWIGLSLVITGIFTLSLSLILKFILEYMIKNGYEMEEDF